MAKNKEQKGFIIPYFMLPAFEKMGPEATGRFVLAMGYYSKDGAEPDFSADARADMLWCTAGPWLDQNKEAFKEKCLQASFAGWVSSLKAAEKSYMQIPFDDWKIAHKGYEDYCSRLPPSRSPVPFTDWLQEKREQAKEEAEGKLPWDDNP